MLKHSLSIVLLGLALLGSSGARGADSVVAGPAGLRISGGPSFGIQSWTVVLPAVGEVPATEWTASGWMQTTVATARDTQAAPTAVITSLGTWNGVPIARLEVRPWRTRLGMIDVAQQWTLELRFSTSMPPALRPLVVAPWMPPCANALFAPAQSVAKPTDAPANIVAPSSWLEEGQLAVRLRTRLHGVAKAQASTIIATEPRLAGVAVERLALFYRGIEQPLHVYDADGSGTLTAPDEILFVGREPISDSGRLDLWDTTAVFVLTSRKEITARRRFTPLYQGTIDPTIITPWLSLHRRIEMDTGFYHLGSGPLADFTSETALFEGFYWHHFQAAREGYGRMSQDLRLFPARSAQPFSIGAVYNTLTTTRSGGTEHRAEIAINGASTEVRESAGLEQHHVIVTRPASEFLPGNNVFTMFGPGIRERWGQADYLSWIGLEAITIDGPIEPISQGGRLAGDVFNSLHASSLPVSGFTSSDVVVIDTANQRLGWESLSVRGIIAAASAAPIDKATAITPWTSGSYRVELSFGDSLIEIPQARAFCFAALLPNGSIIQHVADSDSQATQWLQSLQNEAVVAGVVRARHDSSILVRSVLRQRGAEVSDAPYLSVIGKVGSQTSWVWNTLTGAPEARGGTVSFVVMDNGPQYAGTVRLPAADNMHLVMADERSMERATVEPAVIHDLRLQSLDADVLYVTHPLHRAATEKLAEFRRRHSGLRTHIVDIQAVRDEYGAGVSSPDALKAYLRDAVMRAPVQRRPQYLVLVGAASWDPRQAVKFGNVGARLPDQIPTYGRPSSDYWYGLLEGSASYAAPHLVVGRLPALTSEQSMYMVDKIIRQDTQSFEPWMRRMLYVGTDDQLCGIYKTLLEDPFETGYSISGAPFCIDTITMCRLGSPPSAGFEIRRHLNSGVQFMHFLGHGAPGIFEIPAWDAPDIDNADRLGFLGTYSCQTGAFSNPSIPCKNASFLMEPNVGFVGVIGGTGWGFVVLMDQLHFRVHDAIRTNGMRNIGDVLYNAKVLFGADPNDAQSINTVMQQCLLGDPLSRVKLDTIADPLVRAQDVRVAALSGATELTQDLDDAVVTITIRNAGLATTDAVDLRLIRTWNGQSDTMRTKTDGALCSWQSVRFTLDIQNKIGLHTLDIVVDDEDRIPDPAANNRIVTSFDVRSNALVPVEPQASWVVPQQGASIRLLDSKPQAGSEYNIVVSRQASFEAADVIIASTADELSVSTDGVIDWLPNATLPVGSAWIGSSVRRAATPALPSTAWYPVVVGAAPERSTIRGRFFRAENHTISINNDDVTLLDPSVRIDILSAGSDTVDQDYRLHPTLRILVGSDEAPIRHIQNPYYRGFNLLMIPDNDSVPRGWRRYDTFVYPDSTWTCCIDGYADELITFLSDSLRSDERVIVALCNESLSAYVNSNRMDTLRTLLKRLGAGLTDSLRVSSSYILVGRLGLAPGQAMERLSNEFNTPVRLDTTLPVLASPASAMAGPFGPARQWRTMAIEAIPGNDTIRADVLVRDLDGQYRLVHTLPSGSGPFAIPIDAGQHQRLYVRTTIHPAARAERRAIVRSVSVDYVPANEWSIASTTSVVDSILRGDTAIVDIHVRNLLLSYSAQQASLAVDVKGGSVGTSERIVVPVPQMVADGRSTISVPIPTARTENGSTIDFELNAPPAEVPELYRFNNSLSMPLTIREDAVPPNVRMEVEGQWAFDGMYSVVRPLMRVYMFDNSWLGISDSTRVNVFINGDRMRPAVADDWAFYPTIAARAQFPEQGSHLRAVVQFRYGLDAGQNTVIIRSQDATGNRDTAELSIYTGNDVSVRGIRVEPNPVSDRASFVVDLAAPTNGNAAFLDIFNALGSRVASLPVDLRAGRTIISWNVRGTEGTSLPQGAYYYRLAHVGNDIPISTGTFVIVR